MSQNPEILQLARLAGYDLSGDDDDGDMSGYDLAGWPFGRKKKRPALSPAQQKMASFLAAAKSAMVSPGVPAARGGVERREQDVGGLPSSFTFGPATAQTVDIVIDPWEVMRPVKLLVESAVVGAPGCFVQLKSASIGPTNMLGNQNPIGIGRYSPLSPGNRVQWGIIQPKIGIILTFITTAVPAAATSISIEVSLGCVAVG